ncbi:hypothetical protein HNP48_006788 [Acidovorax soli]|uniref:Uncharacterized protein n=1 Tax=Acidovorax soli TaxID=592050 RepID=A0A7X0UD32_9BURK|nr:hypothetical protein [Acidovorax soli]MBB6564062.1 hypothetical protein [Acidovorax soli]
MLYAISWFLVLALLALWSLACWSAHALTLWAVSGAGALAGSGPAVVDKVVLPDWLSIWLPPALVQEFGSVLASVGPVIQSALEAVPALSGAISLLAWAVWGVGALVLLALGVGMHLLIALLKRSKASPGTPAAA